MKVMISYPPLPQAKGTPLLSQNRQFQYFHEPTYIYPMVPSYAATLLDKAGFEVIWSDGIAEGLSYNQWLNQVSHTDPDLIFIETKTPVVKTHWKVIDQIKQRNPEIRLVLGGDHVSALPEESMENSPVDFVLTGGDYDFLLLNLVRWLEGKDKKLEPGILYREGNRVKNTGPFQLDHDLNSLPFIDRDLTKWQLYSEKNGNYKERPGTYTMVGRDCWWHRCTFCAWTCLYPVFRTRKPELLVDEIGMLIEKYKVKEVFDDTGTFPIGKWLRSFCELMIKSGYNDRVYFSCNTRFGALGRKEYELMKRAGFRMLLFGLESANQKTLDKLKKGVTVDRMVKECRVATEAGLDVHITIMVGYPWETREDALRTLGLAKMLMEKGWAVTLQSTIVIPYPGTPLYQEALKNGWFRIDPTDYDRFDMTESVFKTPDMDPEEVVRICDEIYKIFLSPKYVLRHLSRMRSWNDVRYTLQGVRAVLGHVKDFARVRK